MKKTIWLTIFSVSMAFAESAVVAYLRAIYYPEGFSFPLTSEPGALIRIEVFREIATICMLLAVSYLSASKRWERFGTFLFCFGIWDIFYYIWLRVLLGWPSTVLDWDILFLIPLPWVGPVIAPVSVSILMVVFGVSMMHLFSRGYEFEPAPASAFLALAGTGLILYSFLRDTGAALHQQMPRPYLYGALIAGEVLYCAAFLVSYLRAIRKK